MDELHLNNTQLSFLAMLIVNEYVEQGDAQKLTRVLNSTRITGLEKAVDDTDYLDMSIVTQDNIALDTLDKLLKKLGI